MRGKQVGTPLNAGLVLKAETLCGCSAVFFPHEEWWQSRGLPFGVNLVQPEQFSDKAEQSEDRRMAKNMFPLAAS